jgi:hypothetical protein
MSGSRLRPEGSLARDVGRLDRSGVGCMVNLSVAMKPSNGGKQRASRPTVELPL